MSKRDDLDAALRELPLFPLHSAVLFPGALLPLHVFEPRYRTLVKDALAGHRAMAIAHVPDPEADMSGNPPIDEVAGAGTIVEHHELPGGRFNIVLMGRARVRIQELRFAPPYRRAIATVLESSDEDVPAMDLAALHAAIGAFTKLVQERDDSFKLRLPKDASPGQLADACAHQLILSPIERQRVLASLDVRERARAVTEVLTVQRAMLAPGGGSFN
jgi:ATP-dependent Lon protease